MNENPKRFKSITLERVILLLFIFASAMIATIGYVYYRNTVALRSALDWEKRTQKTLEKLDEFLYSAISIESGGRGFVITGSEEVLVPYESARATADSTLGELRELVRDNPAQAEHLDELAGMMRQRIATSDMHIQTRRRDGLLTAINEVAKGEGRVYSARIRQTVGRMAAEENRLLELREANLETTLSDSFWIMIAGAASAGIALLLAYLALFSEIRRRRTAELELVEANLGLEQRVGARTRELEEANERLRSVAKEREALLGSEQDARREAEIANRVRDEFMATLSHELRTPLNSVLGWARIIQKGDIDEATFEKAIDTIIRSSETQNHLIEDLLDVGRIVSGKLKLDFRQLDPVDLVRSSVETVRPAAEAKSIELGMRISEGVDGQRVSGDLNRLRQVFWNLLTNAVKFTPEGGRVEVGIDAVADDVIVTVSDNGVGISPEFLPFVFERFRQDVSHIRKSEGLGLGLAIVRTLIERHGGTAEVSSGGENAGATFTVRLPAVREAAEVMTA